MLKQAPLLRRGFTLIELMITLTIIGIALTLAAPIYWEWLQNTQIRTAAESMLVGAKLARAEALKRNVSVRFQLMNSTDSSCALSTTDANWVVSVSDATGLCDVTDSSAPPQIVRLKAKAAGTGNVTIAASPQSFITFDALGRVTPTLTIDIENSAGGACVAASGKMRCLRVLVSAGGQARLCDPAVTEATDPRIC